MFMNDNLHCLIMSIKFSYHIEYHLLDTSENSLRDVVYDKAYNTLIIYIYSIKVNVCHRLRWACLCIHFLVDCNVIANLANRHLYLISQNFPMITLKHSLSFEDFSKIYFISCRDTKNGQYHTSHQVLLFLCFNRNTFDSSLPFICGSSPLYVFLKLVLYRKDFHKKRAKIR